MSSNGYRDKRATNGPPRARDKPAKWIGYFPNPSPKQEAQGREEREGAGDSAQAHSTRDREKQDLTIPDSEKSPKFPEERARASRAQGEGGQDNSRSDSAVLTPCFPPFKWPPSKRCVGARAVEGGGYEEPRRVRDKIKQ